jgi:uncharacterized protein YutE (UPF0331/DUF86 family)
MRKPLNKSSQVETNPTTKAWVAPEIMNWDWFSTGGSFLDEEERKKGYSIWEHAQELLEANKSKHYRIDSIVSIKRCVQQRIDLLNKAYHFKIIPGNLRSVSALDVMEKYGVIRPTMIRKMAELRNAIEHKYDDPPDTDRCSELLDFAWYFLRSTDSLLRLKKDGFEVYFPENNQYWAGIKFEDDSKWGIAIDGWFKSEHISLTKQPRWIEIDVIDIETGKEFYERKITEISRSKKGKYSFSIKPTKRKFSDISIEGKVCAPSMEAEAIYQRYFAIG